MLYVWEYAYITVLTGASYWVGSKKVGAGIALFIVGLAALGVYNKGWLG